MHCWFNHPTRSWIRYPWSPMCTPCVSWHRAGPDWIMNICNVNRYRHWCLYGFRYYCNYWTNPIFINSGPVIGDMTTSLAPPSQNTSGWLRPWPYPSVRYWPFRPYCTRWFWFRPIPWYQYRYLPPLVNAAVAIPNIEFGAGFVDVAPQPNQNPVFPLDPPMVDPNTRKFVHASEGGQGGNSFFDIFVDVGECRWRALLERLGDHDGDGNTNLNDATREILITERSHGSLRDLSDDAFPTRP